jgi:hypothetical protein
VTFTVINIVIAFSSGCQAFTAYALALSEQEQDEQTRHLQNEIEVCSCLAACLLVFTRCPRTELLCLARLRSVPLQPPPCLSAFARTGFTLIWSRLHALLGAAVSCLHSQIFLLRSSIAGVRSRLQSALGARMLPQQVSDDVQHLSSAWAPPDSPLRTYCIIRNSALFAHPEIPHLLHSSPCSSRAPPPPFPRWSACNWRCSRTDRCGSGRRSDSSLLLAFAAPGVVCSPVPDCLLRQVLRVSSAAVRMLCLA